MSEQELAIAPRYKLSIHQLNSTCLTTRPCDAAVTGMRAKSLMTRAIPSNADFSEPAPEALKGGVYEEFSFVRPLLRWS